MMFAVDWICYMNLFLHSTSISAKDHTDRESVVTSTMNSQLTCTAVF